MSAMLGIAKRGFHLGQATPTRRYGALLNTLRMSASSRELLLRACLSTDASSVPRIASSSFWNSIIPKAFRRPNDPVSVAERQKAESQKSKEWNPATFFIFMAMLIGSNAIQMIALRNQNLNFSRKAEAKISLLKEVIQRVKNGEEVDVEGLLGTGNPEKEKEWEEVMKEIESDDALWQKQEQQRQRRRQQDLDRRTAEQTTTDVDASVEQSSSDVATASESTARRRPGFF